MRGYVGGSGISGVRCILYVLVASPAEGGREEGGGGVGGAEDFGFGI